MRTKSLAPTCNGSVQGRDESTAMDMQMVKLSQQTKETCQDLAPWHDCRSQCPRLQAGQDWGCFMASTCAARVPPCPASYSHLSTIATNFVLSFGPLINMVMVFFWCCWGDKHSWFFSPNFNGVCHMYDISCMKPIHPTLLQNQSMVRILLWNLTFVFWYEIHVCGHCQTLKATYIQQTIYMAPKRFRV